MLLCAALAVSCKPVDSEARSKAGAAQPAEGLEARLQQVRGFGLSRRFEPALGQALSDPAAEVRHVAARSLSLLDDPAATAALARALASTDLELVRRSADGLAVAFRQLGKSECDALGVALVRLQGTSETSAATRALARALGGCEGSDIEPTLRAVLVRDEAAGLAGIGRLARAHKKLQPATFATLLDRALGAPQNEDHLLACLEPLARIPWPIDAGARLLAAEPLPVSVVSARIYAQLGAAARPRLIALAEPVSMPGTLEARAGRFEALRALARLGAPAEPVFVRALEALLPENTPSAKWVQSARGAEFAQILLLAPAEAKTEPLRVLLERAAQLGLEGSESSARLELVRCEAASRMARSAFDSAAMLRCAQPGSLRFELARLVPLARSPIRLGRLPHFEALLASSHLRVREAALAVLEVHPEALASDWGKAAIVRALGSVHPGEVIAALAAASKLPEESNRLLLPAFEAAAVRPWPADAAELIEALLGFGRARHFESTEALARRQSCNPAQPVRRLVRESVQDAPVCPALPVAPAAVGSPGPPLTIVLQSPAGPLTLHLDPRAAPASVAEIGRLAAAGFYDHVEMHRVVPGFVVQFGDPAADGYGGSGSLLLHEPSDGTFGPLRIGLAHAGFDTASSQLFVTTGPAAHLDGDYTWLGQAEGPWQDLVSGDLVSGVQIVRE